MACVPAGHRWAATQLRTQWASLGILLLSQSLETRYATALVKARPQRFATSSKITSSRSPPLSTSSTGSQTAARCSTPTSSVTGIGVQKAIQIFYNAMLMKTTSSSYPKYRLWTLQAAKNLFPGGCTEFNAIKAAWNAVSVPAQRGEATCP